MFTISDTKTFKDSVHGYINIPRCFVKELMDNEYFQRLRNIEQTGMRVLYPNAKHDRFTHSLGVFHLGQRAVDDLLDNFSKDQYWNIESDNQSVIFWAKNKVLFLIACLLHDIGHAPFSHALEAELLHNSKQPTPKVKNKKKGEQSEPITDYITNELQRIITENEKSYLKYKYNESIDDIKIDINGVAPHEQIGALLVLSEFFRDKIANIFNSLNEKKFPRPDGESILYAEYYDEKIIVDKIEFENEKTRIIFQDDLCFIARMIMGLKYEDWHPQRQIRNCFIELLNGKNFDVDKLDYIVRDTQMSGINNISVDVDRLLNSLCIVTKTKHFQKKNVAYMNLPQMTILHIKNLEGNGVFSIDGEFQGKIVIKRGAKVKIKKDSNFELLNGVNDSFAKIHYLDANISKFSLDTIIFENSERVFPDIDRGTKVMQLRGKGGKRPFTTMVKNATLFNDFYFSPDEDVILSVREKCSIEIEGEFYSTRSIRLFNATSLSGNISEVELLADSFKYDFSKDKVPNEYNYNTFSIGFKKNAINVIANVMDARNYLYLWIYAHHKVIYYANFLIPVLARELFPPESGSDFPNWSLDYKNIKYLDDAYLWTVIKYKYCKIAQGKTKKEKELKVLLDELFTRNYKKSLYKSLAEYDLFFEKYDHTTKNKLKLHIGRKLIDLQMPSIQSELNVDNQKNSKKNKTPSFSVGYFKKAELDKINLELKKIQINTELKDIGCEDLEVKELVYVSADYKMKQLETLKAFIDMKDDIVSISQIPLLEAQTKKSDSNGANPYFYLYYKTKKNSVTKQENELIGGAIKNYFETIIQSQF